MNKNELIAAVAARTEGSKAEAAKYVNAILGVIADKVYENEEVAITDFGKFSLKEVPERQGRNPRTGEAITIEAHDKVVFKEYENMSIYSRKHS